MITGDRESIGDEFGVYSIDDEDQLSSEDTLDGDGDPLDRGYRVPERLQGVTSHGLTPSEQSTGETIDQRVRQEDPDPWSAPDDDDAEDDGFTTGEDADAVRARLRDEEYGRVGRIVAPDEGLTEDREERLVAREGRPTSWDSPEESAMHYTDGDEDELTEVEWDPADEPVGDDDE
ncbi:DUF5709 domain-containing protein [Ornithinimicrobium humiphilum]|uniref:DUF5709 domain-containing protein n=1 Tax=Ornithinimicrobium humiphilum TaxID=125288 RepID=A0A543KQL0_9MICO|nr:DUF5709 domain-containing protein [Ornithinimicrobium humiphilum]TQM97373.1 hypothetical protein FB476_2283 [Ornithinimicrobium humiphilum]